jgi:hypothetical protein
MASLLPLCARLSLRLAAAATPIARSVVEGKVVQGLSMAIFRV